MRIFRSRDAPAKTVDPTTFVGAATVQRLASDEAGVPVGIYRVSFESGGRTNWHSHSGPQWLLVTDGRIRVQSEGEPVHDLEAGDAVVLAPGEKHWHGATPGNSGTHLAVNVDVTTSWMEPVADEAYLAG